MSHEDRYGNRTVLEVLQDQLDGVAAWQVAARARELASKARQDNREMRLDARRRLDSLRRANAALIARSEATITEAMHVLDLAPPRAVVVHRQDWMREKLAVGLTVHGLAVVAEADDGADALGICIAEQPDLVLLEDRLPSMTAVEVLSSIREFAPHTVAAAQVESDHSVGPMLDAGAVAVFNRRVPVALVCEHLADLLSDHPAEGLLLS
jgi:CheY-like chemotaxis protein